ncbi:glycosyltransferase family 2 protein [Cyanobium sp. Candia 9D4]|nr:glycosyltransferase family 2 protein [Cyanobium sp. Candia 9D4]
MRAPHGTTGSGATAADIAVVIPLFNGAPWIRQTLASVLAQTLPAREIIVVDDGSSDDSAAIVRSFPQVALYRHPGRGTHQTRQFGFAHSTAAFITFLDQDDHWHPRHLELLSTLLLDDPAAGAAVSRTLTYEDERELSFPEPCLRPERFDPWDSFPFHRIDTPSFVLIRRGALEAIGGWPARNAWSSDVQAWFQLASVAPMVRNATATAAYRVQHREATSTRWRLERAHEYFLNIRTSCEALARERSLSHPAEADLRLQQCRILGPMAQVIGAMERFDPALMRSAMTQLEAELSRAAALRSETPGSARLRDRVIGTLEWYLRPTLTGSDVRQRRRLVRTLHRGQPATIRHLGRLVPFHPENAYPTSVLIGYLLADPWQPRAWWQLLRHRGGPITRNGLGRLGRFLGRCRAGSPWLRRGCRTRIGSARGGPSGPAGSARFSAAIPARRGRWSESRRPDRDVAAGRSPGRPSR